MRPRALLVVALVASLGLTPAYAEAPSNDSFAAAIDLTLPATVQADTAEATTEPGEPGASCAAMGATVWYRYTAPADQMVTFDTNQSPYDYNTVVAVWSGTTLRDLQQIDCNDRWFGSDQALATVGLRTGQTVYVQVGGFNFHKSYTLGQPAQPDPFSDRGLLTLEARLSTDPLMFRPPVNDGRDSATVVQDLPFNDRQLIDAATFESGERRGCYKEGPARPVQEQLAPATGSVWYSFEPETDGPVRLEAGGWDQDIFVEISEIDPAPGRRCVTALGVYGIARLSTVFDAVASRSYEIRVSAYNAAGDGFRYPTEIRLDVPESADAAVQNLTVRAAGSGVPGVEGHARDIDFDVVALSGDWYGTYTVEACPGPAALPVGECDVIASGYWSESSSEDGHVHVSWTPAAVGTVTVVARTWSEWIHDVDASNNSASVTTTIGPIGEAGAVVPCADPYEWGYVCPI